MHLVVLQVQAHVMPLHLDTDRKVGVEVIARCNVMPFGAQIIVFHIGAALGKSVIIRCGSDTAHELPE